MKKMNYSRKRLEWLTANIDDQYAEPQVKAFLDKMALNYTINAAQASYNWWKDEPLLFLTK
ncbi:hypothetical protein [Parapedobacter tibetensis]|uniref:hypothetical protein n=1 Tax=Parapedobacter tibetensis TaxID=2972951 RepID=UPI00214D7D2B|nr:hypothetical protein [Parapedobacter tibetensis]